MVKYLLAIVILTHAACVPAQTASVNKTVNKAYAFSQQVMPGTVMVDINGNQVRPDPVYHYRIFIETKGSSIPQWKTAWVKGTAYRVTTKEIREKERIGTEIGAEYPTMVQASAGSRLWELVLENSKKTAKPKLSTKQSKDPVILEGMLNGKTIVYTISKLVNIEPLAAY